MGLYALDTLHSVTKDLIYLSGRHTVATVCLPLELIRGGISRYSNCYGSFKARGFVKAINELAVLNLGTALALRRQGGLKTS